MPTRLRLRMRAPTSLLAALVGTGVAGCDLLGPSGPEGPGYLEMELLSPSGAEGAAVFELAGGAGLGEVTTEGGEAYHQHSGRTSKVVVLLDDPGTIRFRVATTNVGKLPQATVLQVAGADNGLRASLAGYDVRVERVEAAKGGAR